MRPSHSLVAALLLAVVSASISAAQTVQEPGNGVSLPTVVKQVKPDYTPEARAARIEGTVRLVCVVRADGRVGEVTVERSLDADLGLDRKAVDTMKQWEFKPGTKDGKAVDVRVHVEMTFTLK